MAKGNNSLSKTAVWVLLGLLILGLGGFGATNLSGTVRTVGTVGDKSIPVDTYARQLQQEIRAIETQTREPLPFAQAQAMGLDRAVLQRLVAMRALDHEAADLGLSVGDTSLRDRILDIPAFRGVDGEFDREGYRFSLQQAGLSEAEFETQLREEVSRTLLQGAVLTGIAMPDAFVDTILSYVGERRTVTWARLTEADLAAPVLAPSDTELRAFYDENIEIYTLPETKQITFAALQPEDLLDTVQIDEATLRQAYEDRSQEFNQPERRLVERLVYIDETAATEAQEVIAAGGSFDDAVSARGLSLQDVDLGDVSQADLGEAGEAVFATAVGAVVGPLPSDLGPALFRVNGVLPAMNISFEEAESLLRPRIAMDRALRLVEAQAQSFDDMLAGGATLEELADETDMRLGSIDWSLQSEEEMSGYPVFREAAARVTEEDFPEIARLDDGGLFALRLDGVLAPRPAPFDDVRDTVEVDWRAGAIEEALSTQIETILPQLQEGADFTVFATEVMIEEALLRSDFIGGVPSGFMRSIFEMAEGAVSTVRDGATVIVVRLERVEGPAEGEETEAIRAQLETQASDALSQDLFAAFSANVTARANPQINQQALQAVHVNFP
ncbi:MAG: SurA N-terminal domain-containing protein [Pseudomonadota bacterium]